MSELPSEIEVVVEAPLPDVDVHVEPPLPDVTVVVSEVGLNGGRGLEGPAGPPGPPGDSSEVNVAGQIDSAIFTHVEDPTPHPAYDDGPSLMLLYQNAKV